MTRTGFPFDQGFGLLFLPDQAFGEVFSDILGLVRGGQVFEIRIFEPVYALKIQKSRKIDSTLNIVFFIPGNTDLILFRLSPKIIETASFHEISVGIGDDRTQIPWTVEQGMPAILHFVAHRGFWRSGVMTGSPFY